MIIRNSTWCNVCKISLLSRVSLAPHPLPAEDPRQKGNANKNEINRTTRGGEKKSLRPLTLWGRGRWVVFGFLLGSLCWARLQSHYPNAAWANLSQLGQASPILPVDAGHHTSCKLWDERKSLTTDLFQIRYFSWESASLTIQGPETRFPKETVVGKSIFYLY